MKKIANAQAQNLEIFQIKKGNNNGGQIRGEARGQMSFQDKSTEIVDLFVYHKSRQKGTNTCAANNGGCSELCLYVGNSKHKCACPSHHFPSSEDTQRCVEPDEFLLFGQKNKISRLLLDEAHPEEVHDLVLPVHQISQYYLNCFYTSDST